MSKIFWLVVIAAILVAGYYYRDKLRPKSYEEPANQEQTNNDNYNDNNDSTQAGNTLEGTLRASNDKKRGNLMLELSDSDRIIYMTSSRDFTEFYNKDVTIEIEGDLSGFRLIDIKAR